MSFETTETLLDHAQGIKDPDEAAFALHAAKREMRLEAMTALATAAADQLDQVEKLRRLIAYAKTSGRGSAGTAAALKFLDSKPPFDRTAPIKSQLPALEWLRANKAQLENLFKNL